MKRISKYILALSIQIIAPTQVFAAATSSSAPVDWTGLFEELKNAPPGTAKLIAFGILNVTPDAPPALIKSSYLRLAKQLHPDRNPSADANHWNAVAKAYEILTPQAGTSSSGPSSSGWDSSEAEREQKAEFAETLLKLEYDWKEKELAFDESLTEKNLDDMWKLYKQELLSGGKDYADLQQQSRREPVLKEKAKRAENEKKYLEAVQQTNVPNVPLGTDALLYFKNNTVNPIELIYSIDGILKIQTVNREETILLGNAQNLLSVVGVKIGMATGLIEPTGTVAQLIYGESQLKFMPYVLPSFAKKEGFKALAVFEREGYFASRFKISLDYDIAVTPEQIAAAKAAYLQRQATLGKVPLINVSTFEIVNNTPFKFMFSHTQFDPTTTYITVEDILQPGERKSFTSSDRTPYFSLQKISYLGIHYKTYEFPFNNLNQLSPLGGPERKFDPLRPVNPDEQFTYEISIDGTLTWEPSIRQISPRISDFNKE